MAGCVVAVIAVIAVVVAGLAGGGFRAVARDLGHTGPAPDPPVSVADQFVYTARTANDAAITLPGAVRNDLLQDGLAHQSIELIRVDYTGDVSPSYIDMTPRTGNSSTDPPLKVAAGRAGHRREDLRHPDGRQLRGGHRRRPGPVRRPGRITFTGAPVTIISSGLDLANPDNFRLLNWSVPPAEVVADVKKAGALPALHGPVTFVLVPTAGPQPQLGQAQKDYIKAIWTALLTAAGATSVTFIDANSTTASYRRPRARRRSRSPALPTTPIPQVRAGNDKVTCTVPDSYFIFNTADADRPRADLRDLTPCITAALAAHATFALDGWTSYEGPLNADGKPEFNYPYNLTLSDGRVQTIANLLVNDLEVPWSSITHLTGHGNVDQPNPGDPRSAANRVVIITYTIK